MDPKHARCHVAPLALAVLSGLCLAAGSVGATEPCDDFDECKALIEINSSDGDIGFHFLMDADDLVWTKLRDPNGRKLFQEMARGSLKRQHFTETFVESSEPLCWDSPEADPDDEIVTLEEFLGRWSAGNYRFRGRADGEKLLGESELTYQLPAAPQDVSFDGSVISWSAGDDLGNCATAGELDVLVADGVLPMHPQDVEVDSWEIVMEPDLDDGDPQRHHAFSVRVAGDIATKEVTVPQEYLDALEEGAALKMEVGAIGGEDNATFTEADGFCNTVDGACP
jgi:hypothetical protein